VVEAERADQTTAAGVGDGERQKGGLKRSGQIAPAPTTAASKKRGCSPKRSSRPPAVLD